MTNPRALEEEGRALLAAGKPEEAERCARQALAEGGGSANGWHLLAVALRTQGHLDECRRIYELLVDKLPGNLSLRFELAETLLLMGEFERGWREYHHRYGMPHTAQLERRVQRPRWDGRPIPGKTLLIHDEQGYGDTFQFLRMVAWAKARAQARVVLQINHEQAGFARRSAGADELVLRGQLPPPFDVHCEMMSLPMAMGLTPSNLPGAIPYLSAEASRVKRWRKRLASLRKPLVGLVWAGRPTHLNDANRSMTLDRLAPLAVAGGTFLALQKGPSAAQALTPPPGMRIERLDGEIADFEDTAAILTVADLLVSVDSAPVHLAGALGRPAWVLLPYVPDWRWLMRRDDSPWYPTLRLFRQPSRGDWDSVCRRIAAELPGRHGTSL
ncbi:tetratricopeptide repeat-containing glycosyltransferase family protein (plasmid) [Azospirillum sp. A26]|uniref:glycosyltransferase family 9 protein n=1 Tax=Azospirillum sp. A26 TaxID=3160607 RepID=UPI00366C1DBE